MSVNKPWLIVGLGNPGERYANNWHNLGHLVVEAVARSQSAQFTRHRAGAQVASTRIGVFPGGRPGPLAHLAWLECYMNVSGAPTAALAKFFNVTADRLVVVHDELDLPPHVLRLKRGGGEGGHNGLRSITSALGTRDYARLRVGIGRPPGRMDSAAFVLSDIPKGQREDWAVTVEQAAAALTDLVTTDFAGAQQRLHT